MTPDRPLPDPTRPMRVPPRPPLPTARAQWPSQAPAEPMRVPDAAPPTEPMRLPDAAPPTEPMRVAEPITEPRRAPAVEPDATTLPLPVVDAPVPAATPAAARVTETPSPPFPWQTEASEHADAASSPASTSRTAPPPARPKKRHRGLRVTLGIGIPVIVIAALVAVGWVGGNAWAHSAIVSRVAQETRQALNLPTSHAVDVTVADPMLPQLIGGTLSTLTVQVPDAPLGGGSADVTLHATGVPVRGDAPATSATAEISMPTANVTKLAGSLGRTVPGSLRIEHGDVVVSLDPSQFLSGVSFALTLRPSVADGALVLTPVGFDVGGLSMPAGIIRDRFGALAAGILAPRRVCVATAFPRGMTLTGLTLGAQQSTAAFRVDPRMLNDTALQKPGTCR